MLDSSGSGRILMGNMRSLLMLCVEASVEHELNRVSTVCICEGFFLPFAFPFFSSLFIRIHNISKYHTSLHPKTSIGPTLNFLLRSHTTSNMASSGRTTAVNGGSGTMSTPANNVGGDSAATRRVRLSACHSTYFI
jgi:hypothetical protein